MKHYLVNESIFLENELKVFTIIPLKSLESVNILNHYTLIVDLIIIISFI